jgi:hypothetical protein
MSPLPSRPAKSPIWAAIGISLTIGLGALVGTAEPGMVEEVITGRFVTRAYTEAQQAHTVAIVALENNVGHVTSEIDFLAKRIRASIRRNEEQTFDRFAQMDAEIAALKDKIAGVQSTRPMASRDAGFAGNDVAGLRSSMHDMATAHNSAVSALTKRLDKIEVTLGLSTDVTSSIGGSPALRAARRMASARLKKQSPSPRPAEPSTAPVKPEHGHLFNIKPISQQGLPLRLSGLRD